MASIISQASAQEPLIRSRGDESSRVNGNEHEETLKLRNELACVLSTQSKFDEAIELFENVLAIRLRVLHAAHKEVMLTRRNLSLTYEKAGRLPEAEEHMTEVYIRQKESLGEANRETLSSQKFLAMMYKRQGRLEEAERMLMKCLDISEANYGMDRVTTPILNDLAMVLKEQGKHDSAKQLLEKCIRVKKRSIGNSHPSTRASVLSLAKVLQDIGEHEETVQRCHELLPMVRVERQQRPELTDILKTMRASLKEIATTDARTQLVEVLTELLALSRIAHGPSHHGTGFLVRDLAAALKGVSEFDRALPYYREYYALKKAYKGDGDRGTLTALSNLATCYKSMDRLPDALPIFRDVLEKRTVAFGEADSEVGLSLNNLAMALYKYGGTNSGGREGLMQWQEAQALLVASHSCLLRALGRDHADTRNSQANLAILDGRLFIAHPERLTRDQLLAPYTTLTESVAFFLERFGPDHPWTAKFKDEVTYVGEVMSRLR
jgi:tetratricopeptide (TPR) repeat protein